MKEKVRRKELRRQILELRQQVYDREKQLAEMEAWMAARGHIRVRKPMRFSFQKGEAFTPVREYEQA